MGAKIIADKLSSNPVTEQLALGVSLQLKLPITLLHQVDRLLALGQLSSINAKSHAAVLAILLPGKVFITAETPILGSEDVL